MSKLFLQLLAICGSVVLAGATTANARISIAPYASISSTKSIKPGEKGSGTENETIKQRQTYGLRLNVGLYRALKFQFSIGQNQLTTTEKVQAAADEFGEIDYEQDLNMSTDDPEKEVKITETQNLGKVSLVLDPSFSIFILRAKAGVTARQRIVEKEEEGVPPVKVEPEPTYKPHAGAGAGVRIGRRTFFMAEYSFYFYKFPETEPFERQVSVSFGVGF